MASVKKKVLWISLLLLASGLGFAAVRGQAYLEKFVHRKAETILATPIHFEKMELLPFEKKLIFHQVKIPHPDRPAETLGEIEKVVLKVQSFPLRFEAARPVEMELHRAKLTFTTNRNGEWELAGRIPLLTRGPSNPGLAPLDLEEIRLHDGEIEFRDGRVSSPPLAIKLAKVEFVAHNWDHPTSSEPLPVNFTAEFVLLGTGSAKLTGEGDFLSTRTSFQAELKMKNLPLAPLAAYYERGLPARVKGGSAAFSTRVRCDQDQLKMPIHAEVSGLRIELKKNKEMQFMADSVVDTMKNARGNVEMDIMVSGDLKHPRFVVLTDLEPSLAQGFKAAGNEIKQGFKGGWKKFKGLF